LTLLVGERIVQTRPSGARRALIDLLGLVTSTSVFLSVNAQMVAAFSSLLYGVRVEPATLLIAFLATFSVYNMNRATDVAEDSVNRPEAAGRGADFYLLPSVAAAALCLLLSVSVGVMVLLVIITTFAVSVAYSVRLFPLVPRLKEVVGVKSVLVALSWGFTGALLPAAAQPVDPSKIALAFAYIFIMLLVNTVLCDVCDVDGDVASGVRTLPIVLGLGRTRNLLLAVNSLMLPWLGYCLSRGLFLDYMPALFFGMIYGYAIVLVFSGWRRGRLMVELAVDGEWIPLVALMRLL
jgi:4-hydroxybenzoate polyprenyltransferase